MEWLISTRSKPLRGQASIPGDKSISQRAAIMASLAQGTTRIIGYLEAEDAQNTLQVLSQLGAKITRDGDTIVIEGVGERGFSDPKAPLDLGNSGTGLRLMLGAVAGHDVYCVFVGDDSLSSRPMARVVQPLTRMGAQIDGRARADLLPLSVRGSALRGIDYQLPVASAQVKSAILLAGLKASGVTKINEPLPSRDHTERMLPLFGVDLAFGPGWASLKGPQTLSAVPTLTIPKDPSSAAFMIVAGLLVEDSEVTCEGVSLNPTRIGWVEILQQMGADVTVTQTGVLGDEPIGTIAARTSSLKATVIEGSIIPRALDELPILCVAAALADGTTVIKDAHELRVKESDRLEAIRAEWENIGIIVKEHPDGLEIEGPQKIRGGVAHSRGDHRIAMSLAVAGLVADHPVQIADAGCIRASFPNFLTSINTLGAELTWEEKN